MSEDAAEYVVSEGSSKDAGGQELPVWVNYALFVSDAIIGQDDLTTLVKVFDAIGIAVDAGDGPLQDRVKPIPLKYAMSLDIDGPAGGVRVALTMDRPDGTVWYMTEQVLQSRVFIPNMPAALSLLVDLILPNPQTGVYWVNLYVNDKHITRSALRVAITER